jgi:carbonic anhydrase
MSNGPDSLLERNRRFAATDARAHVPPPVLPTCRTYLITCIDPRVDPAAVLGVGLGDALVARCAGGRVTDDVVRDLAWIHHLHGHLTPDGDRFEVVVMHHTECGAALFADDAVRDAFAARTGADGDALARLAVTDPERTVALDVDAVLAAPGIPTGTTVSGWVYDTGTGLVTVAVPTRTRAGS